MEIANSKEKQHFSLYMNSHKNIYSMTMTFGRDKIPSQETEIFNISNARHTFNFMGTGIHFKTLCVCIRFDSGD